ncbi:hypothetical protein MMYC01_206833 [Madurella mycetomatis]|uniref:Uncharacterized protein n=1 Tax=Madurella mycetomatis TaxID=100816 RepID=A0A175VXR4_9PEZI|nr:hypothetical protein MMYC01_206833 [Madurella mycetomatis]
MPAKSHHRSRSSIDRVFDLLADLEDTQITLLLDDLNHTTPSNVPVSQAIALFEHSAPKPKRKHDRPSSPVRTLQAELERRHSKRISSAPEPRAWPKAGSQPTAPRQSMTITVTAIPDPLEQPSDRSHRLSFTLPSPAPDEHPETSASPSPELRPRSYKRISRPMLLSPTATAELHQLLLAYFSDAPVSTTSTATPSPTTPHIGAFPAAFSPFEPELEPITPGLDLLEPSPTRTPQLAPGRSIRTTTSMSSIFEVLRSN